MAICNETEKSFLFPLTRLEFKIVFSCWRSLGEIHKSLSIKLNPVEGLSERNFFIGSAHNFFPSTATSSSRYGPPKKKLTPLLEQTNEVSRCEGGNCNENESFGSLIKFSSSFTRLKRKGLQKRKKTIIKMMRPSNEIRNQIFPHFILINPL